MNTNIPSSTNTEGMDSLFVKKIRTGNNFYIYDVCSNEIIRVNRILWDIIDHFHKPLDHILHNLKDKYNKSEVLNAYDSVWKAKNSGIFSSHRPKIRSDRKSRKEILYLFENGGLQQLIIDLTNQCNMRCHYCVFSGKYKHERTHNDREISRECAIKAVDYFMKNSSKKGTPFVTFYGGEPFLKFELFKDIVDHVKSYKKSVHFSLTTNGTLLSREEIRRFLIENKISINVSLDGPKLIHDRHRVMRNGEGSFDQIMENLRLIKESAPDFFLTNVFYTPVITPPYDFDAIKSFFYKSDFFKGFTNSLNIAAVSTYETTFFDKIDMSVASRQYKENRDKLLMSYKRAMISEQYDEMIFEKNWFKDIISSIHFREKKSLNEYFKVFGQCTPGIRRLFVNADGEYYMCEKVGEFYCIGDIDNGLDFDRILNFYEECDAFFKDCGNCWALRLCKRCFADINCEDQFDKARKENFCKSNLAYFEAAIGVYCEILDENPDAFQIFKPEDIL